MGLRYRKDWGNPPVVRTGTEDTWGPLGPIKLPAENLFKTVVASGLLDL